MTTTEPTPAAQRGRRALQWTGIVIGGLFVILLVGLAVLDAKADALRGPLARLASSHLGRTVHIDGRLELHLLSLRPRVVVRQLRIDNPAWVRDHPHLVRIGQLQISFSFPALFKGEVLLPYVGVDDSDIVLIRDASQRANWEFTPSGRAAPSSSSQPTRLPLLGSLHLGRGHLFVQDEVRKLHFTGSVAADQAAHGETQSLSLDGKGEINGADFQLTATGDPLIAAESHKPFKVSSRIRAGKTQVQSSITITKPFDMGSVVADINASGDDLADLYYLTGLALPNTSPYTVSGHLQRSGSLLKLTGFKGTLGNSDINGTISIETARERPLLTADLTTRLLDIKDLGPTLGTQVKAAPGSLGRYQAQHPRNSEHAEESSAKARAAAPNAAQTEPVRSAETGPAAGNPNSGSTVDLHGAKPKSAEARTAEAQAADTKAAKGDTLLPDAKLDLKRIRGMDAKLKYRAAAVKTPKLSISEIALDLSLERGVLRFTPLSFVLPQGKLTSNVSVDGSKDVPEIEIDTRLTQVQLSQFKAKDGTEPLDGTLVGRAILHGRGKSLHELGSTAAGTVTFVVPHGDIRAAFAELLGIDAARGLGLLLAKNQQKSGIRCGVANFKGEGGVLAAQDIVIDTDNVLVTGKGEVDLGPESLDLTLSGQPKKVRLFRLRTPIHLGGTLLKPKVSLNAGNAPGQAAVAATLGVVATPLAAVLAFIDPGLAKDADCGSLLAEAQKEGAPQVEGASAKESAPIKDARRPTQGIAR